MQMANVGVLCRRLAVAYVLSAAAVLATGLPLVIPWTFLPYLVLVVIPFALVVLGAFSLASLQPRITQSRVIGLIAGVAALAAYNVFLLWLPLAASVSVLTWRLWLRGHGRLLLMALVCLMLGYAAVWNGNYLAGALAANRLHDPTLAQLDRQIYRWWLGELPSYSGLFPIVRRAVAFQWLESGYFLLFPQVLVTLGWVAHWQGARALVWFLQRLFLAYAIGLLCFVIYPAVGPPIFFPESFDPAFHASMTYRVMQGMADEFSNTIHQKALAGFGYFVALPSLHVTASVFMQGVLWRAGILFWFFLPITVVLVASTCLLGYHYIVDVIGGLALAGVLLAMPAHRE